MFRDDGYDVIVYESIVKGGSYDGWRVVSVLNEFIAESDAILANRISTELDPVRYKVICRDIFRRD